MWPHLRTDYFLSTGSVWRIICYEFTIHENREAPRIINCSRWPCVFFIFEVFPFVPFVHTNLKNWFLVIKLLEQTSQVVLCKRCFKVYHYVNSWIHVLTIFTARFLGGFPHHFIIFLNNMLFDIWCQSAARNIRRLFLASTWIKSQVNLLVHLWNSLENQFFQFLNSALVLLLGQIDYISNLIKVVFTNFNTPLHFW